MLMLYFKRSPLLIFATALIACASTGASLKMASMLPTYPGAHDIDRRALGLGSAQQTSYKVQEAYPSVEVLSFYNRYFVQQGWKKCTGQMEEWRQYIDATRGANEFVHDVAHYFTKEDEGLLAMVVLRYESTSLEGKGPPKNVEQQVVILVQRPWCGLQEELERLSIACSDG